jgi:hypothetical protein
MNTLSSVQAETTVLVGQFEENGVLHSRGFCPATVADPTSDRNQCRDCGTAAPWTTVRIRRRSPTEYTHAPVGMLAAGKVSRIT